MPDPQQDSRPVKLTNKQRLVFEVLRRYPEGIDADTLARKVTNEVTCSTCGGTGEGDDDHWGCRPCYGRGHPHFSYSRCYQNLQSLRKKGLATRRCKRDEWGDELPLHIYLAVPQEANPDDPLERLWNAPTAQETK